MKKLDQTDRNGLIAWGVYGAGITLMLAVPALLVPIAIFLASVMILSVVIYWVTTPPHLFDFRARRLERARVEGAMQDWIRAERAKHPHSA